MPEINVPNKSEAIDKDIKILGKFILIYCEGNHGTGKKLCADCQDLLNYTRKRRKLCPLDPKPECKHCPIHCYKPEYRKKVKQVMQYSGRRFYKLIGK